MSINVRFLFSTMLALSLVVNVAAPGNARHKLLWANLPKKDNPRPNVRDKWALLVGVNKFQDKNVPPLKEAVQDVAALKAVLTDPTAGKFAPDHVLVLTGKDATAAGVTTAVNEWLMKKALPDDLVFVYFASVVGKSAQGEPVIFCHDTQGAQLDVSAINLKSVLTDLRKRIQSRYLICAIDASPAPGVSGVSWQSLTPAGVSIISATDGQQASLNNGVTGSSVFVHHLAEAIRLESGAKSLEEMFQHVASSVADDAERAFGKQQTPWLFLAADFPNIEPTSIGVPVKSSVPKQAFAIGHPLDPAEIPALPTKAGSPQAGAKKAPAGQARAAAKPAKSDDDDEDDEKSMRQVDFGTYIANMKLDIQKNWHPPKGLTSRKLVAVFTIMRDGRIVDAHLTEASGVPELDNSALQALKDASPLTPLPPGAPLSVDIKYKFDWQVRQN